MMHSRVCCANIDLSADKGNALASRPRSADAYVLFPDYRQYNDTTKALPLCVSGSPTKRNIPFSNCTSLTIVRLFPDTIAYTMSRNSKISHHGVREGAEIEDKVLERLLLLPY
ncbi:hypothetical protein MTP99_010755 [Tenebrio molitor]|jgi:hypothetical protein|nr:hypothetical protein MTP99_010755 [Tenebrio molitor]